MVDWHVLALGGKKGILPSNGCILGTSYTIIHHPKGLHVYVAITPLR